jgi:hypothetical protein
MRPYHVSLTELKLSRVYCVLKAYFDESYDNSTMCVGGWLCLEDGWKQIEDKWLARIEHERRIAIKHGHEPISRYHATDCGNLKKEFSEENGWNIPRQIRFTKKLTDVIGTAKVKPEGFVFGMSINELKLARPDFTDKELKWWAYYFCFRECLDRVGKEMQEWFTHEKVSVIYEGSTDLSSAGLKVFQEMKDNQLPFAHHFKTVAPGYWADFTALQPADLIAYEGFKLSATYKRGSDHLRKSLEALIGHGVQIRAGIYNC